MRISFHGADRGVTGSCHRILCGDRQVLVDCGMFQGSRELEEDNGEAFGFEPGEIDDVVLTHAHLDHCGRLPLLVKRGFRGTIHATAATRELAQLVLMDSAHLQEEDASRRRRKGRRVVEPLYDAQDVFDTIERFGPPLAYETARDVAPGIRATFFDAGHILGSASVLFELQEGPEHRRVLFSGDLGTKGHPIIRDPARPPQVDTVVMETTYGNRAHRSIQESIEEFVAAIREALEAGGKVIVPTFALERAQELLYVLREAVEEGRLPADLPVCLDSPMAISATQIFRRHPECYDAEACALFDDSRDPFSLPGLRFLRLATDSMRMNDFPGSAVILAGSGMCTGGRVRHHLRRHLSDPRTSVVFVGYAAQGTLARRIIDGADEVQLFGETHAVRARVHTIGGFSAHADQAALLAWHASTRAPRTILVHGEPRAMRAFEALLPKGRIERPRFGDDLAL